MPMEAEIRIAEDGADLTRIAARALTEAALGSIEERGTFRVALTGGRTAVPLYRELAAGPLDRMPWESVHFYWGDERCVPQYDRESNFGSAHDALLEHIPVPVENVHPMAGAANDPQRAAEAYEVLLQQHFGRDGETTFDLTLLGMGEDGHIASLFPGSEALAEQHRWVMAAEAPADRPPRARITLTLPALNRSREVLFLVSGESKRDAVARVLRGKAAGQGKEDGREGEEEREPLPAAMIRPQERLLWIMDREAAPEELRP